MGGYGSGRPEEWPRKKVTEDFSRLNVFALRRMGLLQPGKEGAFEFWNDGAFERVETVAHAGGLALYFRREGQFTSQTIEVECTSCHYGGERPWFLCPEDGCGKRIAHLLFIDGRFICRVCRGRSYASQKKSKMARAFSQGRKIRKRLGGIFNTCLDPFPDKPKGMHWKTYYLLMQQTIEAETFGFETMKVKMAAGRYFSPSMQNGSDYRARQNTKRRLPL